MCGLSGLAARIVDVDFVKSGSFAAFREIKTYVVRRQCVMVSEGNSIQSAPAIADENVINNQFGETVDFGKLSDNWTFDDIVNVTFP